MIEIAGLFGLLAFVVASLAVGIRILLLAKKTRLLPETTVGLSLFLAGGLSTALLIAPLFMKDPSSQTGYLFYQFGSAIGHIGYGLLFVFVWRVFRREEMWAAVLYWACTACLVAGGVGIAVELQPGEVMSGRITPGGIWFWVSLGARFVGYSWAASESFRYYGMLKKRLELGLADASVVSRFLCWGVSLSAVVCIWINMAMREIMAGSEMIQSLSFLLTAVLGFVVAGSLSLAFFPMGSKVVVTDVVPEQLR